MQIKKEVQNLYRRSLKKNRIVRDLVFKLKVKYRYLNGTYCAFRPPTWHVQSSAPCSSELKIAVISDKMTWTCISNEFQAHYLTPENWRETMEQNRPHVFFCESAWEGLNGEWTNEIFRNQEFSHDNRHVLKDILSYCRLAGIPTVFWNKEDTPAFDDAPQSFIETALLFDHVFTTAAECIPKYKGLGHNSVHLMMFGYLPAFFYPAEKPPEQDTAVFLGSWYADNTQRCDDMRKLFQMVLDHGLELRIYDRMSERQDPARQYPEEYRSYLRQAVPYEKTGDVIRQARYVININSVKDSETMFARRVFEAMACGRMIISNESRGMRNLFPGRVWFIDETFDIEQEPEAVATNLQTVIENYTFKKQLSDALCAAGIVQI